MTVVRGVPMGLLLLGAMWTPQPSAALQGARPDPAQAQAALRSASPTERALAACHLGRMTTQEVRPARDQLLAMLTDDTPVEGRLCRDYDRFRRSEHEESTPGREAAMALEKLGAAVLAPLVRILEGPNATGRENAALGLGLIEDRRVIPALASALRRDNVARVRARSAWALGMIEDPDAIDALTRALRGDGDGETRGEAAWALGMIEDPAGVPPLLDAFDDAEAEVRSQAAWALGMIQHRSGVPGLNRGIEDSDPGVRSQAAWGLGMIEHVDGVGALAVAVRDTNAGVRSQAAWALGMIESPGGVDPLVQALGDSAAKVRSQAAWGLGMIESSRATSRLVQTLGSDRDAGVRSQAAWALGMIEDPDAAEALLDAIEDENESVQEQAMWALTRVLRTGGFSRVDRSELAAKLRRALRQTPASGTPH